MNNLLNFFAIGSIIAGILVITSSNPVVSVLFLVTVFILASCYLLTLGVSFVGLTYLIVYVGAVAVLFLFVVRMLNIRVSEIVSVGIEHTKSLPLGAVVGILFTFEFISILPAITGTHAITKINNFILNIKVNPVIDRNYVNVTFTNPIADTGFAGFTQIQALGQGLYSHGALGLLLASCLLLLARMGPILTCIHSDTSESIHF